MEILPEEASSANPRGDVFIDLAPRSLLARKRESLNALYESLYAEGAAPAVHRDVEKLWTIFDAALETQNSAFLHRYLDEICFSPELIPFSPEAYFHSTHVILDWCQKFHSDAERQILEFRHDSLLHLPQKCENMKQILTHCMSHLGGDPERQEKRTSIAQKLIHTTEGVKLAALVACWRRCHDNSVSHQKERLSTITSDVYLASQSLPPMWLEHYPFQDENKMMEIVFLNKEDLSNPALKHCKLAMLGFFLMHGGQMTSLEFLTEWFGIDRLRATLWQGLFLVDLCIMDDNDFYSKSKAKLAVESLKEATAQLKALIPVQILMKLQTLGCAAEANEMFLARLETYLQTSPSPLEVARQGLSFCLFCGDVSSGLLIVRGTLLKIHGRREGMQLLRYFFDQILGNGKLDELVMLDLTGMEEAVFIDWAGNKRDDPECSLYLALYFFKQSKTENTKRLYHLNADKMQHSMHKELWNQLGQAFKNISISPPHESAIPRDTDDIEMSESSNEEEVEEDMEELIRACPSSLPSFLQRLLDRSYNPGQLVPSYSDSLMGQNLCPLQPPEEQDLYIPKPTASIQDSSRAVEDDSGSEVFYDAMETLEE